MGVWVSPPSRYRGSRSTVWAWVVTTATLSANAYASPGDGPLDPTATTVETSALTDALAAVDSPFFGIREAAVAVLESMPRTARPVIREAFRSGTERRRAVLAPVLADGAEVADIRSLVEALVTAIDPATAAALRVALIEHAEETADIVADLRKDSSAPTRELVALEDLLARARIEALFLSRKSTSGGTGSYDGQYAILRTDRKRALELAVAILANEDLARPGVFPIGSFRFLRPPAVPIVQEELQSMAANAISELCEDEDTAVLARLVRIHEALLATMEGESRVESLVALGLDDIVLPTLVRRNVRGEQELRERIMRHVGNNPPDYDDAAHILLRLDRFGEAVRYYRLQIANSERKVIPYYNLACAYARWSTKEGADDAGALRNLAAAALGRSVEFGYADWPWMEQDKDLDAIRAETRYLDLVAGLKARYPPLVRDRRPAPPATAAPK